MDYSVWEICAKINVIKDFVLKTDSLRKALTLASTVRRVKKVLLSLSITREVVTKLAVPQESPSESEQSPKVPSTTPTPVQTETKEPSAEITKTEASKEESATNNISSEDKRKEDQPKNSEEKTSTGTPETVRRFDDIQRRLTSDSNQRPQNLDEIIEETQSETNPSTPSKRPGMRLPLEKGPTEGLSSQEVDLLRAVDAVQDDLAATLKNATRIPSLTLVDPPQTLGQVLTFVRILKEIRQVFLSFGLTSVDDHLRQFVRLSHDGRLEENDTEDQSTPSNGSRQVGHHSRVGQQHPS